MFQKIACTIILILSVAFASFTTEASDAIDAFIEEVRTPSYDCPSQSLFPQLEKTLLA